MNQTAKPDHPIHDLLIKRWSPYAFDPKPIPSDLLRSLFEAASWAASSYNEQPWRFLLATRDDESAFQAALDCLFEANREWAKNTSALVMTCTRETFTHGGKPNRVAQHDLGAAAASLTFEATARGLYVHQMAGVDLEKMRTTYEIPEGYEPQTAIAIGYAADLDSPQVPSELKERDRAERTRKPLDEFVFHGTFGKPSPISESPS